jgi:hypothetical protein
MLGVPKPVKNALRIRLNGVVQKAIYLEEGCLAGKPPRNWRVGAFKRCRIRNTSTFHKLNKPSIYFKERHRQLTNVACFDVKTGGFDRLIKM